MQAVPRVGVRVLCEPGQPGAHKAELRPASLVRAFAPYGTRGAVVRSPGRPWHGRSGCSNLSTLPAPPGLSVGRGRVASALRLRADGDRLPAEAAGAAGGAAGVRAGRQDRAGAKGKRCWSLGCRMGQGLPGVTPRSGAAAGAGRPLFALGASQARKRSRLLPMLSRSRGNRLLSAGLRRKTPKLPPSLKSYVCTRQNSTLVKREPRVESRGVERGSAVGLGAGLAFGYWAGLGSQRLSTQRAANVKSWQLPSFAIRREKANGLP